MMKALDPKDTSVLIVEDSPDDARLVAIALERFGIKKLFVASTAEEALAFLPEQPCDVVLADYNLPGMNGVLLLERIRESWPETRVIIVTGVKDDKVAASAIKAGAVDYVAKDELLTSGIVRSLQAALREKATSDMDERRESLAAGTGKLEVAREEADWLADSLFDASEAQSQVRLDPEKDEAEQPVDIFADDSYIRKTQSSGEWDQCDVLGAFASYLRASFSCFPSPATKEEDALVRMLMERGTSPAQVLLAYRASLRSLNGFCQISGRRRAAKYVPPVATGDG